MATLKIQGLYQPSDYIKVRDVIDNHPEVDELVLKGPFYFGHLPKHNSLGKEYERKTVVIKRGIRIRGVSNPPRVPLGPKQVLTVIYGGGAEMLFPGFGNVDSGPFKIETDQPVVIDSICFAGWKGEAILAQACGGLKVTNCIFTLPVATAPLPLFNNATFVNAVFAVKENCKGNFVAARNVCNLSRRAQHWPPAPPAAPFGSGWPSWPPSPPPPSFPGTWADDEQFACCFGTKFTNISIVQNEITGHDDGLEVMFNNLYDPTLVPIIKLNYNSISLAQHVRRDPWPGSTAIVCCNNENADTEIIGNVIITTGSGGTAFVISGNHDLSTHPFKVANNECHQDGDAERHLAAIQMGSNYPMPFPTGSVPVVSALNQAQILNNNFSGITKFGFVTHDILDLKANGYWDLSMEPIGQWPTGNVTSQGNVVSGNNLSFLDCKYPEVILTTGTGHNTVTGCFQPPALNMAPPENANIITATCAPKGWAHRLKLVDALFPEVFPELGPIENAAGI